MRLIYPNAAIPSIRIRAVLELVCTSVPKGDACGRRERYESADPDDAVALARRAGWTFRGKNARCPGCGRRGESFGKAGV